MSLIKTIGIILVLFGSLFLLRQIGVVNLEVNALYGIIWPIGLILSGIMFIFGLRIIAIAILLVTGVLGGFYIVDDVLQEKDLRTSIQEIPNGNYDEVTLDLNYGAGELIIREGTGEVLLRNRVNTTFEEDPKVEISVENRKATIKLTRENPEAVADFAEKSKWDIEINPAVESRLFLNYGASDVKIDLRKTRTTQLEIDTGASSTEITFGKYDLTGDISIGAADLEMAFPKNTGIKVEIESGISSVAFPDFKKDGNTYTKDYNVYNDKIELTISAGAASIRGEVE